MKQMKNYLFLFIAFLGILFSGCEKDTYLSPLNSKENKLKVRDVSLKMIPQIEEELDSVKEFLKTKSIQNRTIYDFNLNEEQIKELQLANGDVNYSFIVEKQLDENIPYYFENLEITLKDSGYDAYVLKWIPADGNVFGGLDKFTGELQYQDLDGRILQSVQMFEGLLTQSKQITQTVGCIHYVIHIDTEGNSTIMSSYDDCGGGGSGGPNTGTISGINSIENGGFSGTNSNYNSPPHSSNGQYYYLTYNGPSYGPIIPTTDEVERVKCQAFLNSLSTSQYNFLGSNQDVSSQIFSYLIENWFTLPSRNFMKELIDLSIAEQSQGDAFNLVNLSILVNKSNENLFEESFSTSLDPYLDLDITNLPPDTSPNLFGVTIFLNYVKLRQINPEWSRTKCVWEASKDIIHLSLDAFGLIPVGGEIADLVNGTLYTIEGEGLNATLSYTSAIPIVGWATAGTKFGLKVINTASTISTKVKLVWKITGTTIEFGNRAQLRKVLGLVVGNPLVAHHIIPWAQQGHKLIQRAAKSANAFHMNEALNGIPLSTLVHNGSHAHYDGIIVQKMDDFIILYPNATPDQCYTQLMIIIQQAKTAILNNPNTPINLLNF